MLTTAADRARRDVGEVGQVAGPRRGRPAGAAAARLAGGGAAGAVTLPGRRRRSPPPTRRRPEQHQSARQADHDQKHRRNQSPRHVRVSARPSGEPLSRCRLSGDRRPGLRQVEPQDAVLVAGDDARWGRSGPGTRRSGGTRPRSRSSRRYRSQHASRVRRAPRTATDSEVASIDEVVARHARQFGEDDEGAGISMTSVAGAQLHATPSCSSDPTAPASPAMATAWGMVPRQLA